MYMYIYKYISKCLRQSSARGRIEGFPQMGVSTIICGCVLKVFQHLLFYKNGFEHQRAVIDFKETSKPEIVKRSLTRFEPMA